MKIHTKDNRINIESLKLYKEKYFDALNGSKNEFKSIIFSYLVARKFNTIRLPTYADRFYSHDFYTTVPGINHYKEFQNIDEGTINTLLNELDFIYQETQRLLQNEYQDGKITLERAMFPIDDKNRCLPLSKTDLDYVKHLYREKEIEKKLEIEIELDILSSWSKNRDRRYGNVTFKREWDIKDIVLYSGYLKPSVLDGGSEWLCLNRNIKGILKFDSNHIIFDKEIEKKINNGHSECYKKLNLLSSICTCFECLHRRFQYKQDIKNNN